MTVVAGGPQRLTFSGSAAGQISRLIDAATASSTLDEAALKAGIPPELAQGLWDVLLEHDLLEEEPADAPLVLGDDMAGFAAAFGRGFGDCGASQSSALLARSRVGVSCEDANLAAPLLADLRVMGITGVDVLSGSSAVEPGQDLVVALDAPGPGFDDVVAACGARGVPLLRMSRTRDHLEIGPLFYGNSMACLRCFRHDRDAMADLEEDAGALIIDDEDVARGLLASLVCAEVASLVGHLGHAVSRRAMTRTSLSSLATRRFVVTPHRTCPEKAAHQDDADSMLVALYENFMGDMPAGIRGSRSNSRVQNKVITDLQGYRERLPSWFPRSGPPGHDLLVELVRSVAGRRAAADDATPPKRWTPSAGNLGSCAAFVIVPDREPSLSFYDEIADEFVRMPVPVSLLNEVLDDLDGIPAGGPGPYIVLVGCVGRIWQKYGDLAFRLAHLDAGFACTQLAVMAAAHGVETAFARAWSSNLAALLQLRAGSELVTAVARVNI
ncbi:hypothetical protein [Kitasatospora sp. LaBMicrA B282]|uniref:hypothetical protein n=1 Tax=Kitasatospora sp. LaBMicrA B282 TaxID=3420949 RepID=UPI003D14C41B